MRVFLAALLACGCGRVAFEGRDDAAPPVDSIDATDGGTQACGVVGNLRDTFEGTAYDADRYAQTYIPPGTSITVAGGEVALLGPSNMASQYVGLTSYRHYSLLGSRFVAEVTSVPANGEIVGMQLAGGSSLVIVSYSTGTLTAAQRAPTYVQHVNTTYSPIDHRFWAISESGGTLSWETSADGINFTPLVQMPAPFDLSRVRTDVFAGAETNIAAPQAFRVTSLGAPNAAPYTACAPSFTETFDVASVLQGRWLNSYSDPCCGLQISGGNYQTTTDGTVGYAWLRSAEGYDMRGHSVSVELVQASTVAGTLQALVITRDYDNKLALMKLANGSWDVFERVDGAGTSHAFGAGGESFLRISVGATTYTAEVSTDAVTWRPLRTAAHPFAMDDVTLELEGGSPGGAAGAAAIVWDNFTAQ